MSADVRRRFCGAGCFERYKMAHVDRDELVPDPVVLKEFSISAMCLWRWDRDEALGFPPPVRINQRKYRSRRALEAFKQALIQRALRERSESTSKASGLKSKQQRAATT
jgi:hypothetical protein